MSTCHHSALLTSVCLSYPAAGVAAFLGTREHSAILYLVSEKVFRLLKYFISGTAEVKDYILC